ncbi:serine hydrolase [uncultured Cyclobacterium sp.]|uniref:serine hydrolase domain-containing protein n=1 Tax=uncultured Cyclobacterium sp. TaxID=453820 RepID=UPI0030EDE16D
MVDICLTPKINKYLYEYYLSLCSSKYNWYFKEEGMKPKNPKPLKIIIICPYLISLVLLLLLISCSGERNNWEGIWQAKIEYIPELYSNFDLELNRGFLDGEWSGRYEVVALLDAGKIPNVKVANFNIEMDFGHGQIFKGKLSKDKRSLEGIFYDSLRKNDTLKFVKVSEWTSEMPARIDKNGEALDHWNYSIPEPLDDDWNIASLESSIISQKPLHKLFQKVIDGKYQGLDAVLITHNGKLVLEEYFHLGSKNRLHTIQSCTKSVTSLLMGIAHDNGLIGDLDQPIQYFFPKYIDTLHTATWPVSLKDALTMSAGLDWNEWELPISDPENDVIKMLFSQDMYDFVLKRNIVTGAQPGDKFEYNSGLSVLLGGVILDATGMPADTYAEKTLFNQLGIQHYHWFSLTDEVHTGGGLWLGPRDFLKMGQLVLGRGKWNKQQIISESWIEESTAFHLPHLENSGYGYHWWRGELNVDEMKFPIIYAAGYGGQFLFIVPGLELVTLFLHHNPKDLELSHTMAWKEMEKFIVPSFIRRLNH